MQHMAEYLSVQDSYPSNRYKWWSQLIISQHMLAEFCKCYTFPYWRPNPQKSLHKPIDQPELSRKSHVTCKKVLHQQLKCISNAWCIHWHCCVVQLYPVTVLEWKENWLDATFVTQLLHSFIDGVDILYITCAEFYWYWGTAKFGWGKALGCLKVALRLKPHACFQHKWEPWRERSRHKHERSMAAEHTVKT